MIFFANGIVIDQYSDVLLMKHAAESTHRPPGSPVRHSALAPDTAVGAVRSATGLVVLPVRLAGMTWWPDKTGSFLFLHFRCILRGGDLETPDDVQAGFFKLNALPLPTHRLFEQQLQTTVSHKGGPPFLAIYQPALIEKLRGVWSDAPREAPRWQSHTCVIVRNRGGAVLWQRTGDRWHLPESAVDAQEPPWATAAGLVPSGALAALSGIYTTQDNHKAYVTFTATSQRATSSTAAYFVPGSEPEGALPQHVARVADSTSPGGAVAFRMEDAADAVAAE